MGYVAIDSTVNGRSWGGVRIMPDIDKAEMRGLAHAMTLKFGFLGLPQGGAKAWLRGDPEAPLHERRQRLAEFGRAIAPLLRSRVYIPAADMGTNNDDIRYMLNAAGVEITQREFCSNRSAYYTAVSVFTGAKRAIRYLAMALPGCKIAIDGFGKVGSVLGGLFAKANARVVAISTSRGAIFNSKGLNMDRLTRLAAEEGSRVVNVYENAKKINHDELLELPVDIVCPCSLNDKLNINNADRIIARIVCSGANNPITPEAEQILFSRGVLCLPFFVTNCGGILGGTMEFASVSKETIELFIDRHVGSRISWILEESLRKGLPPIEIAVALAMRRFNHVQQRASHPTPAGRLFHMALEIYRRGGIPRPLVAALSLPYFRRTLT
jgi:glutamate dehydrogenase (NAD(P)+)